MARIGRVVTCEGVGGFFFDDEEAIKQGAPQDGFVYQGKPVTPGYTAIRMPARQVCLMLVLSDGQVAHGDCIQQQYSGRSGRDALLPSGELMEMIDRAVTPRLRGRELDAFRDLADEVDGLRWQGERLPSAVRFGVTQALLDAVAKARRKIMAEVIAEEYGLELADEPIPLAAQGGDDWMVNTDKMVLKRIDFMPYVLCNTIPKLRALPEHIRWVKRRIAELADDAYRPTLFYDFYGTMGLALDHDIPAIAREIRSLEREAQPYSLILEDPIILSNGNEQFEAVQRMRQALAAEGTSVRLVADEWVTSMEDIRRYAEAGAMDIYGTHPNDLGGINRIVEAFQYLHAHGVAPMMGGTCAETERAAQVKAHIALATRPLLMLATPGMGVDEGVSIVYNEMQRALALRQATSR